MKEYKSNEELINYLLSKGVVISNKKDTLEKIERYTYYSIVNTYKNIFKDKRCMEKLLTKEQYKELYNSISAPYLKNQPLRLVFSIFKHIFYCFFSYSLYCIIYRLNWRI